MSLSRERVAQLPGAVWRGIRRATTTSWATRGEYVVVLLLAGGTELGVRTLPLARLARLYRVGFGPAADQDPGPPLDELPMWAARRLRVVTRVMRRWPVQGECLRHSLVAGQRLRALRPELKLGVATDGAGVVAHAWLAIAGRSLDPLSAQYEEFPSPRR